MRKSIIVGDRVELNGKMYTVTHSWLEHTRFDVAKRCIRMETALGDSWAGYKDDLNDKLNGVEWDGHSPGACSCPGGC